jgi:hypothetical protein
VAKLAIKQGTPSKLLHVFIQDSTSSSGAGLTGLLYNAAGLIAYYLREGDASATAITLATMTVGTWASGGFKEVDATHLPGLYELGLPNAALSSGASVVVMLSGAANMVPVLAEIELDGIDYANGYMSSRPEKVSLGTGPSGADQLIEYEADGTTAHKTWTLTTGTPGNYTQRS